ncbi:response regulator transcription factor, partial [uncultured Fusobacterium sp.]|uniref:winged helix-turn-helix domain-containing protein n=1 Tax=uncultured Fusobacterium sp. TaxID=159267 RepID=UPI0025D5E4D7
SKKGVNTFKYQHQKLYTLLLARIKTILKNRENRKEDILKIGKIEINDISHTVSINGEKVDLAPKEYEILMYMIKNSNIALRREKMLVEIWGYDFEGSDRIIDVHIKNLRKKIGEEYIKTVRNIGYKFEID